MNRIQHYFAVRYPDLAAFPRELDERIARHGLHLKTAKPLQVGEEVGIQFRFPQREEPLRAVGVVAWVSPTADPDGKRGYVIRELRFDAESQRILELVRSTPPVEEAELATPAAPPPPTQPPTAPEPTIPPRPAPATATAATPPAQSAEAAPVKRWRTWLWILILLLLLAGGASVWIFFFGGERLLLLAFGTPPPAVTLGPPAVPTTAPEPPLPAPKKAPPPKRILPPVVIVGFDYFQRPSANEFTITFNRPVRKVYTSRIESPLMQVFYIERAKVRLEKEQYFLPYDLVRTVTFEEEGGVVRISFLAQRSDYLPEPQWELRGRELHVRFVATD